MSNFLLLDPKCVLIHIPKTGGSSIRHGIWESNYEGPTFGQIPDDWQQYFKFAFVRHPLDRFVSAWSDFTQLRRYNRPMEDFIDAMVDESIIYDERRKKKEEVIRHHTIPQTHPFNCLKLADFVGRYERYEEDVERILTRVGKSYETLPAIRKTVRGHWQEILTGKNLSRVIDYYAEDFDELGYTRP